MRVIVTGGTGFIGRALAASLAGDGHEVVIPTRNPDRHRDLETEGIRLVSWDGRTAEGWGSEADGAGAVVNLAGENIASGRWNAERKDRIRRSRLDAGQAVVEAVEKAPVKPGVVVQASAVGWYGDRGDEELFEEAGPGEGWLAGVAREWEGCTAPVEEAGVRRVVIRTGVVLGTEGGALPRLLTPFRIFLGGPLGSGKQWFSWIHLKDEIGAIRFLIENGQARGAYNLVGPKTVRMKEFCRTLGKVMWRPSWLRVPALSLRLLFGEMAKEALLASQRARPRRLETGGYRFAFSTAAGALRDILS